MKKVFLVAMLMLGLSMSAFALEPTDRQVSNFKNSVMSYVRSEGYSPKIDSDGDIEFRYEGSLYWVRVSSYDDGYYCTVMTIDGISKINYNTLVRAADKVMRSYKFARIHTSNDQSQVYIRYDWYCTSLNDFKAMFGNALSVVSICEEELSNEVSK